MTKKVILFFVIFIAIVGIFYTLDKLKYTSFAEILSEEITEDDEVKIVINRYSDDARVSITDKVIIEKIMEDFSDVELKKENVSAAGDYAIRIYVNSENVLGMEIRESGKFIWITTNRTGNDENKVVSDINYLETIKNEGLEWEYYE